MKKVTLQEIANSLGISRTTVWKVFSGHEGVSDSLRTKVIAKAQELGYAIQAGRELRVVVGSEKISDAEAEKISFDIAKRIQDEMTYPGQVKVTVIRETRAINYAK